MAFKDKKGLAVGFCRRDVLEEIMLDVVNIYSLITFHDILNVTKKTLKLLRDVLRNI